jgi:hypothetical protein
MEVLSLPVPENSRRRERRMEVFAGNRQRHAPSFTMPDFRTIIDAVISSHDHADIAQCGRLLSDEAATNPTVARAT